jgi:hypothetical protein
MNNIRYVDGVGFLGIGVVAAHDVYRECIRFNSDPTLPPASVGAFSSATVGYGVPLSKTMSKAFGVYADDGGAALTAGAAVRAFQARTLLAHAGAAVDASAYGAQSQVHITADVSAYTGIIGGEWGYLELVSGGKVNIGGAVVGHVDVPTGATVTSHAACFLGKSNDLGGTHTGLVCGLYFPNPGAGTFDGFADFGSATGMTQDAAAGSNPGKFVKLYINGVLSTIATAIA